MLARHCGHTHLYVQCSAVLIVNGINFFFGRLGILLTRRICETDNLFGFASSKDSLLDSENTATPKSPGHSQVASEPMH